MSNKAARYKAEETATEYLTEHGFEVLDQNWHTRWCEIDIVAKKDKTVYFVEVKSRKNSSHGTGLDYITSKKIKQMSFAAEMWVSNNKWQGQYQLSAVAIDGEEITFIEDL